MEKRAIVIGSGMGGLAAAQVLSKHFDRVTVIEKDDPQLIMGLSSLEVARLESKGRPGVHQFNQVHVMSKGSELYDKIFDGRYSKALQAGGGKVVTQNNNLLLCHPASGLQPWHRFFGADRPIKVAVGTRHLFEKTARQLVADNPKVDFVYGVPVDGLVFANHDGGTGTGAAAAPAAADNTTTRTGDTTGRVTGVRLSDGTLLHAQLVVDASGRGSNLPGWLAAAGSKRPHTSRATSDAGYVGWLMKFAPEVEKALDDNQVQALLCFSSAPTRTTSLLLRVEDGLCIAAVGSNEGEYPGFNEQDILRFAREKVWHPAPGRLLAGSTCVGPFIHCQHVASTWRHYEDVQLPDGVLPVADSICAFNPAYGQGMTVAAIEAGVLDQLLSRRAADSCLRQTLAGQGTAAGTGCKSLAEGAAEGDTKISKADKAPASSFDSSLSSTTGWLSGLNKDFQQAVLPTIKTAWMLAAGNDMRFPSASSNDPINAGIMDCLVNAYVLQLFGMASSDVVVTEALLRVIHMLDPPESLMAPRVLIRFLLGKVAQLLPAPVARLAAAWLPKATNQGNSMALQELLGHKPGTSAAN